MRYPQVLKFVGKLIFERGLNYYQKKAIKEINVNNRLIQASVQGSLKNLYSVRILMDDRDDVISADCDCPYWSRCKHIAAVLINYFEDKTGLKKNLEETLPVLPTKQNEITIPINFKQPPGWETMNFLEGLENHTHQGKTDDGKDWQLVFKLKKQRIVWNDAESYFVISPALQYIKNDGTGGNIYNYSPRKIYSFTQKAYEILQKLLNRPDNKDDFYRYIDDFINYPDLNLFFIEQYKTMQVIVCGIRKTVLDFELIEMRDENILFSPILTFYGENNITSTTGSCIHYPINSGIIFSVLSKKGNLFYVKNNPAYAYCISHLLVKKKPYSPSDIKLLKTDIQKLDILNITVNFKAEYVKMKHAVPFPVISLDPRFGGRIDVSVTFNYEGNEIKYSEEDGFILHKNSGKNIHVIKKNKNLEKNMVNSIKDFLKEYIVKISYMSNPAKFQIECSISFFLSKFGQIFIDKGFVIKIGKKKVIRKHAGLIEYGISSGIDWFDLEIFYNEGDELKHRVDLNPTDLHHGIGKIGDSYILLNKEDCEKLMTLLSSCQKVKKSLRFSKYNFNIIETLYDKRSTLLNQEIDHIYSLFLKLQTIQTIPEYSLPEEFTAVLRNYQKTGYYWLYFLYKTSLNGCLADDMGLGKTVQTLALFEKLKEENLLGPSLVVVPVTTFANWENEIRKFSPKITFVRHAGRKRALSMDSYHDYDLILISYHTLRNDIKIFSEYQFDYLILDESQTIKNALSKTFKAMRIIKAKHRLSLTGTPVENNTLELWAQMHFLNPGILGSYNDYKKRYAKPIEEYGDKNVSRRLKKIVYPFILRRKKEDVIDDLPEKEIMYKYIEMNDAQKEGYSEVNQYYKERIKATIMQKGLKKSSMELIEALLRLRQMVLFPFLVSKKYTHIASSKLDLLKEMLKEILEENHKVLIFSQFVQVLKQIEEYLNSSSILYTYIDGSTKKREKEIKRFQNNSDIPVFLLSLKAGGLGINLTAADYVIIFDPWWNPAVEKQAIDRTHRIGQKQKVIAYKLIVKDSIEEKIISLQNKKENLLNSLVMNEKNIFKSFDEKDIMGLFDN